MDASDNTNRKDVIGGGRMLRLDKYEYSRTAYRVYGKSIWEIHRETGHDRKTIRKALNQEPFAYGPRENKDFQF